MRVNADFARPVVIGPKHYHWVASPTDGVERVMLDRIGGEKARATSIVRYGPGAQFPSHVHAGGEEILVLSGVFSDHTGDYSAGWYLRSSPRSRHQPFSAAGAVIFVKLGQMPRHEQVQLRIDTEDAARWQRRAGREVCSLFDGASEQVSLQRVPASEPLFDEAARDGAEILVLAGALRRGGELYPGGTWIRLPPGEPTALVGEAPDTTVYLKTGHLGDANLPREAAKP